MEYDYQVLRLTDEFYSRYPHKDYPEILEKRGRAYNCLLIEIWDDLFVCIPFRTEMHHDNGYHFKNTRRSRSHRSGLDYSKLIIASKTDYIDTDTAVVDDDEYKECMEHLDQIVEDVTSYITDYISYHDGTLSMHPREYARRYKYSTLRYFEKELRNLKVSF